MVHPSEFYDDCSSVPAMSVSSVTSPASSSSHKSDSPVFFSDEDIAQIENLDLASMMTPIIKENLKDTIYKRLVETGKPLPAVEMRKSSSEQLTEEEKEKRRVRRMRNKQAAQKCRTKKRERGDMLEQEAEELEERRDSLTEEVERLKKEQEVLQDMLDAHAPFCKKQRTCTLSIIQTCLSNDHTYTLTDGEEDQAMTVANWTDLGLELTDLEAE